MDELVVVRPPKELQRTERTRGVAWKAIPGLRASAARWQDHYFLCFQRKHNYLRCEIEPCAMKNVEKKVKMVTHGDGSAASAYRKERLELKQIVPTEFDCRIGNLISMHQDDDKEGFFLKNKVFVDLSGWHLEGNPVHAAKLVSLMGLEQDKERPVATTVMKLKKEEEDAAVPLADELYATFRSGAGLGIFASKYRTEVKYTSKEILREADCPTTMTWRRLKRLARGFAAYPRAINGFVWQRKQTTLLVKGDSDYASCPRTLKSTTGVAAKLGQHVLTTLSAPSRIRLPSAPVRPNGTRRSGPAWRRST